MQDNRKQISELADPLQLSLSGAEVAPTPPLRTRPVTNSVTRVREDRRPRKGRKTIKRSLEVARRYLADQQAGNIYTLQASVLADLIGFIDRRHAAARKAQAGYTDRKILAERAGA